MTFTTKPASALASVPPPPAPDFELTAATYPGLHRPIYHRAVALGELNTPVVQAIAACLMLSLIEEDAAFREDLRSRALQMLFLLRLRSRGQLLLGAWPAPQSSDNRHQFDAAEAGFASLDERPLEAWFTGPARISQALIPLTGASEEPVLFCGPTTVLAMLYGKPRAFFSLKLPDVNVIRARFFDRLPKTIVIAEAGLPPGDLRALLTSYRPLPASRLIAIVRAEDVFELDGFERRSHEFDLPSTVAHSLNGDPAFRAPLGEPALYTAEGPYERYAAVEWVRT